MGVFTVSLAMMPGELPYQLYDITGKLVASGLLTSLKTQLNFSELQKGMYLFKTQNESKKIIIK